MTKITIQKEERASIIEMLREGQPQEEQPQEVSKVSIDYFKNTKLMLHTLIDYYKDKIDDPDTRIAKVMFTAVQQNLEIAESASSATIEVNAICMAVSCAFLMVNVGFSNITVDIMESAKKEGRAISILDKAITMEMARYIMSQMKGE